MDQATTSAAWGVTADGVAVQGTISFAESDTVLVFKPGAAFTYSQKVVMTVGAEAQSKAGVRVGTPISGAFTTVAKLAAKPTASSSSGSTGGGTVAEGTW